MKQSIIYHPDNEIKSDRKLLVINDLQLFPFSNVIRIGKIRLILSDRKAKNPQHREALGIVAIGG